MTPQEFGLHETRYGAVLDRELNVRMARVTRAAIFHESELTGLSESAVVRYAIWKYFRSRGVCTLTGAAVDPVTS